MKPILNSPWRQTAATIYKKPIDSKILGSVEIDVTYLEQYISQKRKEGLKITLTHIFLLAISRAMRTDIPELNTYVKRGNIYEHPQIDTTVSVLLPSGEMGSVKIKNSDKITLNEVAEELSLAINSTKKGNENATMKNKERLAMFPWPIRNWIYAFLKKISIDWGISLPFMDVTPHSFGSFILSNIGTLGLDYGYPALLPTANISLVFMLGTVNKKPWVVDDKIEIRKIMNLSAALDHRVVDASHAGKLFKYLKMIVRNPELLEKTI